MLVLPRREGEGLLIGRDIRVTVLIIFENRIKLQLKDSENENKVITCHIGATTSIRRDITIKVVGIDKQQVKLGIEAPEDITINREEVQKKGGLNAI